MTKDDVLITLKGLKSELVRHKVRQIALFGSFVRGDQTQKSDIDVLVDFEDNASLFDLIRVGDFLEEKLHRKVDVVPRESLRKEIRDSVLQDMVVL